MSLNRLLSKLTVPRRFKRDGSQLFDCPTCRGRAKLEVSYAKQKWFCHKCQSGGSFEGPAQYKDIPNVAIRDMDFHPVQEHTLQWDYLVHKRGIPVSLLPELRAQCGPSPVRVYLPVYENDRVVWWTSRVVFNLVGAARYYSPPMGATIKRKGEVLWGMHRHASGGIDQVHLCEGIFDALWIPGALAMMGKSLTDHQLSLLKWLGPREVVVTLDGDARTEAGYLCQTLVRLFSKVGWRRIPFGRDVDSIIRNGATLPEIEWW